MTRILTDFDLVVVTLRSAQYQPSSCKLLKTALCQPIMWPVKQRFSSLKAQGREIGSTRNAGTASQMCL